MRVQRSHSIFCPCRGDLRFKMDAVSNVCRWSVGSLRRMSCQLTNYLIDQRSTTFNLYTATCFVLAAAINRAVNFLPNVLFENIHCRAVLLCSLNLAPFMPLSSFQCLELTWGIQGEYLGHCRTSSFRLYVFTSMWPGFHQE